jgi:hypothetical protein
MGILAHFDPDRFPLSLITPEVLSDIAKGDAAAALEEASLLRIGAFDDGRPHASMHRLVQLVTLTRLAENESTLGAAQLAAQRVWQNEENRVHPLDLGGLAAARERIGKVLAQLPGGRPGDCDAIDPEIEKELREVHASASQTLVDFADNVLGTWRQGAHFALHVAESNGEGVSIAQPLEALAGVHMTARRYDEAEAALQGALAIRRTHQGEGHADTQATAKMLEELRAARAAASKRPQPAQIARPARPSTTSPGLWARLFGRKAK